MEVKQHIDGVWNTTEYSYKNCKIEIKSRKGHGMKGHCFWPNSNDKVQFTLRYSFITPGLLLSKIKEKIDKINLVD